MADSRHVIAYEAPSAASTIPSNKFAQVAFGLLIIWLAFKLASSGWFSGIVYESAPQGFAAATSRPDSMGSPIGLLPFMIDGIALIGIIGFVVIKFIKDQVGPIFDWGAEWVHQRVIAAARKVAGESAGEAAGVAAGTLAAQSVVAQIDAEALQLTIHDIDQRVTQLETIHPELGPLPPLTPVKPKTVEQYEEELAALRAQLSQNADA